MLTIFTQDVTFADGIMVGDQLFTSAVLEEEVFAHTLKASTQPGVDMTRLDDQAYFSAAVLGARLVVPGLFLARLKHDPEFRALIEEYADQRDMKLKDVNHTHIHPMTPELIGELSSRDGNLLLALSGLLDKRRSDFRKESLAPPNGPPGADEVRVPGKGPREQKPGGNKGNPEGGGRPAGTGKERK